MALSGQPLEGEQVEAHLRQCEACASLSDDDGELGRALAQPTDLAELEALAKRTRGRLERENRSRWGRLRSLPTRQRIWIVALIGAAVVCATWLGMLRLDFAVYPRTRMLLTLAALGVLVVVVVARALRPLSRAESRIPSGLWVFCGAVLVTLIAGLPAAHDAHPASTEAPGTFASRALSCLYWGTLMGAPLVLGLIAFNRSPGHLTIGLASIGGALLGNLVLQLHCPLTGPAHLLLGHATVLVATFVLVTGVAFWLRRRALPD